jgi:hypothetical protein
MSTPIIRKRKTQRNISNSIEAKQLVNAGRKSASNAIRASKALGLEITYMKDRVIYKEKPNGEKTVLIKVTEPPQSSKHQLQLKKGMIFNVNK